MLIHYRFYMKWLTHSEPLNILKTAKASAELFHKDGIMEMYLKQLVRVYPKRTNQ